MLEPEKIKIAAAAMVYETAIVSFKAGCDFTNDPKNNADLSLWTEALKKTIEDSFNLGLSIEEIMNHFTGVKS